jgi:predicted transcriptional regulator
MQSLTLTASERRRVERLARDAKRTPQAMLRFVLRDGFDYCSYVVKSVNEGIAVFTRGKRTYSTDEVLKHAIRIICRQPLKHPTECRNVLAECEPG